MDFQALIAPISLQDFAAKVAAKETFVMPGGGKRDFNDLISLEEIEAVLNNGCNLNKPMQIIADGGRMPLIDRNLPWSPVALRKAEIKRLLESGHSFMMMNMSQINPRVAALIDAIEARFRGARADLHLYVSPKDDGTGYNAHRDFPQHKIYAQVIGSTSWRIFAHGDDVADETVSIPAAEEGRYLTQEMEFVLEPGDVLYMPPGKFHKVRNTHGPRVSFSFPFVVNVDSKKPRMDRTYIPFQAIFEDARKKAEE